MRNKWFQVFHQEARCWFLSTSPRWEHVEARYKFHSLSWWLQQEKLGCRKHSSFQRWGNIWATTHCSGGGGGEGHRVGRSPKWTSSLSHFHHFEAVLRRLGGEYERESETGFHTERGGGGSRIFFPQPEFSPPEIFKLSMVIIVVPSSISYLLDISMCHQSVV